MLNSNALKLSLVTSLLMVAGFATPAFAATAAATSTPSYSGGNEEKAVSADPAPDVAPPNTDARGHWAYIPVEKTRTKYIFEDGMLKAVQEKYIAEVRDTYVYDDYYITYEGLAEGSSAPDIATFTYDAPTFDVPAATSTDEWIFEGWYTEQDGHGQRVSCIEQNTMVDLTLYAHYTPNFYIVKFSSNGGDGIQDDIKVKRGKQVTLPRATMKKGGYAFVGWNTAPDRSGTKLDNQAMIKDLTDGNEISLYAQYDPITYMVSFNPNGGTGQMQTQMVKYDTSKALAPSTMQKEGMRFAGWNTKADGTGLWYADCGYVRNLGASDRQVMTLYAQYVPENQVDPFENSGIRCFAGEVEISDFSPLTTGYSLEGKPCEITFPDLPPNFEIVQNEDIEHSSIEGVNTVEKTQFKCIRLRYYDQGAAYDKIYFFVWQWLEGTGSSFGQEIVTVPVFTFGQDFSAGMYVVGNQIAAGNYLVKHSGADGAVTLTYARKKDDPQVVKNDKSYDFRDEDTVKATTDFTLILEFDTSTIESYEVTQGQLQDAAEAEARGNGLYPEQDPIHAATPDLSGTGAVVVPGGAGDVTPSAGEGANPDLDAARNGTVPDYIQREMDVRNMTTYEISDDEEDDDAEIDGKLGLGGVDLEDAIPDDVDAIYDPDEYIMRFEYEGEKYVYDLADEILWRESEWNLMRYGNENGPSTQTGTQESSGGSSLSAQSVVEEGSSGGGHSLSTQSVPSDSGGGLSAQSVPSDGGSSMSAQSVTESPLHYPPYSARYNWVEESPNLWKATLGSSVLTYNGLTGAFNVLRSRPAAEETSSGSSSQTATTPDTPQNGTSVADMYSQGAVTIITETIPEVVLPQNDTTQGGDTQPGGGQQNTPMSESAQPDYGYNQPYQQQTDQGGGTSAQSSERADDSQEGTGGSQNQTPQTKPENQIQQEVIDVIQEELGEELPNLEYVWNKEVVQSGVLTRDQAIQTANSVLDDLVNAGTISEEQKQEVSRKVSRAINETYKDTENSFKTAEARVVSAPDGGLANLFDMLVSDITGDDPDDSQAKDPESVYYTSNASPKPFNKSGNEGSSSDDEGDSENSDDDVKATLLENITSSEAFRAGIIALPILVIALIGAFMITRTEE